MTFDSEVLADSPLAYWKLGESSPASAAADASGNGRNGAYVNTPTMGAGSLIVGDSVTSMNIASNTGQCMQVADAAWMDVNAITVECLFQLTGATDVTNGDAIVSRYTAGGGFNWAVLRNTSGQIAFQCRNASATVYNVPGPSITLNQNYYVACTYDGSNTRLYVAGLQAASVAVTGNLQQGSSPIEVGRYSQTNATTPAAFIQRVAIHNSALSAARILAHQAALPQTGVWGWVS